MVPGVWVTTAPRWSTTSTVVVGADRSCLVVDPALSPTEIEGLGRAISERGWRVGAGFATHPHFDHLLWSAALGPAPRYATARCVEHAHARAGALAAEARAEAPGHRPEVLTDLHGLPEHAVVPWSGTEAVVVEHAAHAPGHAALWLPRARTLLVGDMLSDTEVPLLDLEAAEPLADYLTALDLLRDFLDQAVVVVPGHGHVAHGTQIERRVAADRAYLAALADGGTPTDEPRLADPYVLAEHERQLDVVRRG